LAKQARTPFAGLSGGQQQRLLVALALLNSPQVVFLDELTQGLDPAARRETWEVINAVRDRESTVVLVTHFPDEAETLCDRLAIFDRARVVTAGTPADLINRYARSARVALRLPHGMQLGVAGLERIEGVDRVETNGDRVEILGHSRMVAFACAELVAQGVVGSELRVTQGTLEDALLTLMASD
jgi:ABC-2 type transport system ATP-binding protein